MLDEGLTLADIGPRLTVRDDQTTQALMIPSEVAMAIGRALERTRGLIDDTKELELKQDDQADRLQRLEKWARQPWWKKLFTKPD